MKFTLVISPSAIIKYTFIVIGLLTMMSILSALSHFEATPTTGVDILYRLFYFDKETSIPTWFATIILFSCALTLGAISHAKYQRKDRYFKHWFALALIFVLLSVDEAAAMHEYVHNSMLSLVSATNMEAGEMNILALGWIIPSIALVLGILIIYMPFLIGLPDSTRFLFLVSGVIYISGAIGMETLSSYHAYSNGADNFAYAAMTTFEEALEMIGNSLFLFTLWRYMKENQIRLTVKSQYSMERKASEVRETALDAKPDLKFGVK